VLEYSSILGLEFKRNVFFDELLLLVFSFGFSIILVGLSFFLVFLFFLLLFLILFTTFSAFLLLGVLSGNLLGSFNLL
jgi:hypothetical protein